MATETDAMILNTLAEKLKRRARDDFKGRHFEAALIIQAVTWYLRYPLSYRDLESLFAERGFDVDHATINRWVLAYAPLIDVCAGSANPIADRSASTRPISRSEANGAISTVPSTSMGRRLISY